MSSNPLVSSFRYVTAIPQGAAHETVVQTLRDHDKGITDLETAIPLLKSQIDDLKSKVSSTTPSGSSSSSSSAFTGGVFSFNSQTGDIVFFPDLGTVNNQTGATSYTTQTQDNGAFIILSDGSPIAVTLNFNVSIPWFTWLANYGAGTATLTPSQGTITYPGNIGAASMPLASGFAAYVEFDGVNWWAVPISISGSAGTITDVIAGTGLTGGGSSGAVTLAIADTAVTPGNYTNTNLTVNAQGQITAAANGSASGGYPIVVDSYTNTSTTITSPATYSRTFPLVPAGFYRVSFYASLLSATGIGTATLNGNISFTDSTSSLSVGFGDGVSEPTPFSGDDFAVQGQYMFYSSGSAAPSILIAVNVTGAAAATFIVQAVSLERLA